MNTPNNNGQFTSHQSLEVTKVHGDLGQELVQITVDKLSLILHKHASSIEERKSWIAPLGMFVTIVVVLLTSTFKDVLWPADTWVSIFVIGAILTLIWLAKSAWKAWSSESIDDLVERIKRQQ